MSTLTVPEILNDVFQAFKKRVPALNYFAHNYSSAMFGEEVIVHLSTIPTAFDHVAANGYSANAQKARDLLIDVPVVIDGWKDVPIKISPEDASQDRSQNYLKTINNAGYVLGKAVVDYALSKVVSANFSQYSQEIIANTTKDTLYAMRAGMNSVGAGTPRYALVNSPFFDALDGDPRITSSQYYGQRVGADPFGRLHDIEGFTELIEYPDFPSNGENMSAFGFDERAIAVATRLPMDSADCARRMRLPVPFTTDIMQEDQNFPAFVAFSWIDPVTHAIFVVFSLMFGAVAGSQGGAVGDKVDYAGWRVRTS